MISPLAYVDPQAKLGKNVEVKPFAYIEKDVVIGDDCIIMPYASILSGTTMGSNNIVYQNTVIGATPQDFHYVEGQKTHVVIGNDNRIRENVVIAGSTYEDKATTIGNGNFLMDRVHICHDVKIHDQCVIGIGASIAGECEIEDRSIMSSGVIVQQHVRVGRYSLIQSGCRVQKDIPPYIILGGNPACYHGVNAVLLKHIGVTERILRHIVNTYRIIYTANFSLEDAVIKIPEQIPMSVEIENILAFIKKSKHGIVRHMEK
ncbi:acyl-[acyl-carrier-protein]--UDP-N-acetylglucosamine O-acyltransferase [Bacteroidaceae bacterium]|uniref:acyl-ACP--UDP-N-acetylglucosamine O-acyltransferase n=1 Tax=Prevotella sp. MGM2 TaxID=2033406 RepID=UPI000CE9BDE7|nr:acyl-ACP--UDP-N-acetylglucosamine O-acyltransferase [Prevotella sp. MGM2]GAY30346.1 acyl-(Acyl-carrier-protein)-UDP-N-acetylglucosamine O-acyltransferase [Prevotella sp. MGM2]GFI33900.1 acyl-[acyl-carrier-protein]--UDP-N-acetylglucosamine O-acyltransferase [Bacteroidaceae bacterium]